MLDAIWFGLLFCGVLCALCTGRGEDLSAGLLEGAGKGVELTLSLLGSLCAWTGFLHIAQDSGLSGKLAKALSPVIVRLFPRLPGGQGGAGEDRHEPGGELFRAGQRRNAPGALRHGGHVPPVEGGSPPAGGWCCSWVMNTASFQLVPVTLTALRAAYGSAQPFGVLPQVWAVSLLGLGAWCGLCASCGSGPTPGRD